mgnify:CR=1 FL=1
MYYLTTFLAKMTEEELNKIVAPVIQVCKVLVPVLLSGVGALGSIYVIFLAVKYAQAADPQEHEKCKKALKNAIIGFVLIFILLIGLQVGMGVFENWWAGYDM